MKNWVLPLAVLGVCGLGLLALSERGQNQFKTLLDRQAGPEESAGDFDNSIERELESIQVMLNRLSEALQA